ncbi:MAG: formylglycine-generating enzyme family protein [Saprospiraceae bacterium]|jgi:formylglycine-generating enzyme required for sulfatase activity|nr:formylglycine-generating enzyme family protein [Saprospiraceae bacterium]
MPDQPHYFDQHLPDSPLQFRMVRVPAGTFRMGSPDNDPVAYDDEKPQHTVRLNGFWLAETPVTQALWETVMGGNPSLFQSPQRPVEFVSWFDAVVFCNAMSQRTERRPVYLTRAGETYGWAGKTWTLPNDGDVHRDLNADGYCLPTEAEWEHAAREGSDADFRYCGSDLLNQVGWNHDNMGLETRDVALLLPNALGLYDMSGNVYEWCEDWWGDYTAEAQENPRGPGKGINRVFRAGPWSDGLRDCRPAYRAGGGPDARLLSFGFRLALSLQSDG